MDLVCFVDSGDCTAQGIAGVSDVPEAKHAAVGPVLASEYLYHDHVHCFFSMGRFVTFIYMVLLMCGCHSYVLSGVNP